MHYFEAKVYHTIVILDWIFLIKVESEIEILSGHTFILHVINSFKCPFLDICVLLYKIKMPLWGKMLVDFFIDQCPILGLFSKGQIPVFRIDMNTSKKQIIRKIIWKISKWVQILSTWYKKESNKIYNGILMYILHFFSLSLSLHVTSCIILLLHHNRWSGTYITVLCFYGIYNQRLTFCTWYHYHHQHRLRCCRFQWH